MKLRWFSRYMVIEGELRWVEGIECVDPEFNDAVRQTPGMQAHLGEWMTQGIVMGEA